MRREADRVRVTAQLIHVRDEAHCWADSYERPMRRILALQRELAADIGREIRLNLSPQQRTRLGGVGTVNPEAYQAHLKGRHLLNAHLPMWVGTPPGQTAPLALEAAEKALGLDPNLPEAYASLGLIHANYVWDWSKAEQYFERALELNPSCAPARQWYAEFLAEMGRIDDSLATIERATMDDPLSRGIQASRAFILWLGRRFDEAIAEAEQVLELDSTYPMALIRLGVAYEGKGMYAQAVQAFRTAKDAAPGLLDCIALLGYAYARADRRRDALRQLNELRRLARRRYVPPFLFAIVYLGLGDRDKAVRFMENEYDARGWYLLMIRQAPRFDPLRSHPRFHALMRRMNFPT